MPSPVEILPVVYAAAAILAVVFLTLKRRFELKHGLVILVVSTIMGLVFFAPMLPMKFQTMVADSDAVTPLILVGLTLFLVLSLVFGRFFCGYVCPIGAVQELMYNIEVKKKQGKKKPRAIKYTLEKVKLGKLEGKKLPVIIRYLMFVVIIVAGVAFGQRVLNLFGVTDFFRHNLGSIFFYLFLGTLIGSIFFYRPFCRFICPYGVMQSIMGRYSMHRLERTDTCKDCKRCEKVCPTHMAGRDDDKSECYLCMRCVRICKFKGLEYRRKGGQRIEMPQDRKEEKLKVEDGDMSSEDA